MPVAPVTTGRPRSDLRRWRRDIREWLGVFRANPADGDFRLRSGRSDRRPALSRSGRWEGYMASRSHSPLSLALLTACLFAAPTPAWAASQPGVHVDPGSPAGKEYAIPVDSARSVGATHPRSHQSVTPSAGPAAPSPSQFGAGITPAAPAPRHPQPGAVSSSALRTARHRASHKRGRPVARTAPAVPPATQAIGSPTGSSAAQGGSGSPVLWMLALGAAAIALGSGVGVAVRSRR